MGRAQDAVNPTFARMWRVMKSTPGVMVESSGLGIRKVRAGGYAYFMESVMIDFTVKNDSECELTQIGGLLDTKGAATRSSLQLPARHTLLYYTVLYIRQCTCERFVCK